MLGSNQRRLSRRFYSPLLLPEAHPPLTSAYARSRRDLRAAAVRYASVGAGFRGRRSRRGEPATDGRGPAHGRARKRPRTGPAGAVMQTALTRIPALTCHFRMPARCRRRPRHRGLPRRPGCRGPRRCAGWRRSPGRRCSGRRSSAGPRRRARRGGRPRWRAPRSSATATPPRAAGRTGGGRAVTCTGRG